MRVPISKMHGAQNDFVILDRRTSHVADLASFARWACDRHAGVGADGVIAIETSTSADVMMRTINADGSAAEMCGNGIRCAARWLDEAGEGERIIFETEAGSMQTEVVARSPEYLVRVGMGRPRLTSAAVAGIGEVAVVDLETRTSSSGETITSRRISSRSHGGSRRVRSFRTEQTFTS